MGEFPFQLCQLLINPLLKGFQALFRMPEINLAQRSISMEIVHGESVSIPLAIEPYVPEEKRIYYFRVLLQVEVEI